MISEAIISSSKDLGIIKYLSCFKKILNQCCLFILTRAHYDAFAGIGHAGVDYYFPEHNFTDSKVYNFTMSPGERRCFEIEIIDNNVAEVDYKLVAFLVGESDPFDECGRVSILIEDDEGKCWILMS